VILCAHVCASVWGTGKLAAGAARQAVLAYVGAAALREPVGRRSPVVGYALALARLLQESALGKAALRSRLQVGMASRHVVLMRAAQPPCCSSSLFLSRVRAVLGRCERGRSSAARERRPALRNKRSPRGPAHDPPAAARRAAGDAHMA